jgi:hypothetical protein
MEIPYRFANFRREACARASFRFGMEAFATRVLFIGETSQRITLYSIPQLGHLNFVTLLTRPQQSQAQINIRGVSVFVSILTLAHTSRATKLRN